MGYRLYIGELSKEKHNEIKGLSLLELQKIYEHENFEDYPYITPTEFTKELHCFGKYIEFGDEKFYTKVFDKDEVNDNILEEHDCWIVDKEFLKHIIEWYKEKIKSFYKDMLSPINEKESDFFKSVKIEYDNDFNPIFKGDNLKLTEAEIHTFFKLIDHVRSMKNEWGFMGLYPFNLDKGDEVSTSWKYEYSIFELVRIYKSFDWENNLMIYYGW